MSLRSASMLSGVRDIPSDLATVASRSSGILLSPHHVTWARYISQRASRLFDAVRRPAFADRYVLRHPLPMNIPPVSARLRDQKLKQSPIREIMKLADRQNVTALGLDPDDVISFAGGWVNHRAPEALRAAYQRFADDSSLFHELGAYAPTRGLPELREALVRADQALYKTEGLADEHILVGQSSTQLTHSLFMALLDPGDRVLLFDPSYANYGPQLGFGPQGIEIVRLPVLDLGSWSFMSDSEALLLAVDQILERDRPRMMLFSSPDNLTSQMVPDALFFEIVERARAASCFVVVDFAYRAQCFLEEQPDHYSASPVRFPNLVRLHSNSKWCRGLGRRLGWVEAAPEVIEALEQLDVPLRLRVRSLPQGVTLLDDTYNASPASTLAALELLSEMPGQRRIALLGDMLELGDLADELHNQVGKRASEVLDVLYTVGTLAERISLSAHESGNTRTQHLRSKEDAARVLRHELQSGDLLLVKGSRTLELETVIRELDPLDGDVT